MSSKRKREVKKEEAKPAGAKKTKAAAAKAEPKPKKEESSTPILTKLFEDLNAVITKANCLGHIIVQGTESGEDDDEDEEDEDVDEDEDEDEDEEGSKKTKKDLTAEQAAKFRVILINSSRDKALTNGSNYADPEDGMWNTHTGNTIIFGMEEQVDKAMKGSSASLKFDRLFGITFMLNRYVEMWACDNEIVGGDDEEENELDVGLRKLGKTWKSLLKLSNEQLGIDQEYTRPGIECLLDKFEKAIGEVYDNLGVEGEMSFKWK